MANFYGSDIDDVNAVATNVNFYGGDGNDILKGAAGANALYGGEGNDVLTGGNAVTAGTDYTGTGSAADPIVFSETQAPSGDDLLEGGSGSDAIYGFDGDDVIHGGEGDDQGSITAFGIVYQAAGLFGGDGDDVIYGGGGDDSITGGLGQDDMFGGADSDTFFFNSIEEIGKGSSSDYIGDFRSKQGDLIDLEAIDAKENKAGNQDFKFIGDDKFTKAGQVSFKNGKVKINTDNDKAAEAVILVNTNKMDGDDFVL